MKRVSKNCNFNSNVLSVRNCLKEKPNSIPLISDLTSFVQVGDILQFDPSKGLSIIEVKEGETNKRISDFIHFYSESSCQRALYYFAEQEGKSGTKQLGRMLRQAARMSHFAEIKLRGFSIDPDNKQRVIIPEEYILTDSWDAELNDTIEKANTNGWAINIIDNCLFIGCYAEQHMRAGGHIIFNGWFEKCGGSNQCPRSRLIDSMFIPLAMPLFLLHIPPESIFDFLFGRMQLCMGISVEKLMSECVNQGLSVKMATKKETAKLKQKGGVPYIYKGQAIIISLESKSLILSDGLFLRSMFHGQKPVSVIKAYLTNQKLYSLKSRTV